MRFTHIFVLKEILRAETEAMRSGTDSSERYVLLDSSKARLTRLVERNLYKHK